MNVKIQKLYSELHQLVKSSDLPIGVLLLILRDLYRDVESAYVSILEKETGKEDKE